MMTPPKVNGFLMSVIWKNLLMNAKVTTEKNLANLLRGLVKNA